jgi:hypothetical protein
MIVPATRRFVYDPSLLTPKKIYAIDSGMGGCFALLFIGKSRTNLYKFLRKRKVDWPERRFAFTSEQLYEHIFISPPSEIYFRQQWDRERQANPDHPEGWFPPEPETFKFRLVNLPANYRTEAHVAYSNAPATHRVVTDLKRLTWIGRDKPVDHFAISTNLASRHLELVDANNGERLWELEPLT